MQNVDSLVSLRKAAVQALRPVAIIGAVGGFIGDIIQPLGNFAVWIAAISLVGALVALVWVVVLRRRAGVSAWDSLAGGLFVLCAGSFIVFAVWALIFAVGPQRGYLATNVEPIGQLQAQLLGLQKDVAEVKETTRVTATRVAEQGDVQVAAATAQARGFAELQAQFASLQQGSLIANPTTPLEWYSNARLYQLRGDTANAIKAYEGYLPFRLEYVDPLFEYSALLKATEGIARAREIVGAALKANPSSAALDLAAARLLDDPDARVARLLALRARAPGFGPVLWELGYEYDRALGASATADLLKKQGEAYGQLFALEDATQGYTRYFIDKAQAEKNLTTAHERASALTQARRVIGQLDVLVMQYNDGVQFIVTLTESGVQKLLFDIDNPKPARETGHVTVGASSFPNPTIGKLKVPVGKHTLYLQYIDANGTPSEVFSKEFTVRAVFGNFQQQPVDLSTNKFPGTFLIGVADVPIEQLYTYKWSIDSPALDNELAGAGMAAIQLKELTAGEHVLYLRAVDAEGKASAVEQIPFTVR